jgi:hypothetical protein
MTPIVKNEIQRLIINWGYWKSGGGSIAGGIMLGIGTGGDAWGEPRMPLLFGEARFTDQAMVKLLEPQQVVLQAHYLTNLRRPAAGQDEESARDAQDLWTQRIGDQARAKADQLGISKATFYRLLANSQKSFWTAFQLVKLPRLAEDSNSLDRVRQIRMLPGIVA